MLSGLPGVGKTSIAEIVAARTGSVHLSVDAVDGSDEARQTWRAAAARTGADIEYVHLLISDAQEHRRRLHGRDRGLAHVGEPTWADVQRRRSDCAAWSDAVAEIDTGERTADEVADLLVTGLGVR